MTDDDFEGTEILEKLAAIDAVDDFLEAVDSDDTRAASRLMRRARVGDDAIAIVLRKMQAADGEH